MTDRTTSWVHTTCPPGWGLMDEDGLGGYWSVYCCEPSAHDRVVAQVESTREAAGRLAWERWALDVLGPVTWGQGSFVPMRVVFARRHKDCYVASRGPYTVTDGDLVEIVCSDPVEALVRLAALVLAVEGPRC